jgi:hypothetical protein
VERLSPFATTAPLITNFSPGFNESLSGMACSSLTAIGLILVALD